MVKPKRPDNLSFLQQISKIDDMANSKLYLDFKEQVEDQQKKLDIS